jgi:hypothetical protein
VGSKRSQHRFADDADASDDDSVVVEHRILLEIGAPGGAWGFGAWMLVSGSFAKRARRAPLKQR